ncbi:DUF445 domain-containing protein [uncultured Selenomonas sp.]|uniref:DUF445 domain-containing protein n=1 Tax=uncultured Selenomonas sp. TaxID=159275 RepID=UPI0028DB2D7D|nr:DUF445 domain-containing protein [uncultured Selenomonas sp.]
MSRTWNKADTALISSTLFFLLSLYLHLHVPSAIWTDGLLMVSEAALVGGVADWFAVTALFRRPLGFPYHTAILPRRRDSFIHAIVVMVQKEFFSRRKIFRHIEKIHLFPMLQEFLRKEATETRMTGTVLHFIRASFLRKKNKKVIAYLAERLKGILLREDPSELMNRFDALFRTNEWDRKALVRISCLLAQEVLTEETRQSIRDGLAELEREKIGDGFLSRLLEVTNTVNLDEGAELIQRHTCHVLNELGREYSPLQENAIALLHDCIGDLRQDAELLRLARELQERLACELPIEETLGRLFQGLRKHFQMDLQREVDPIAEHMPAFYTHLQSILHVEYQHMLFLIEERSELQKIITKVLYDLLARSALHAQTLVGVIVRNVLSRLTDEELNHLIYDKVEEDLLWIRVNGSLVGGCIGLLLFICMNIFS